MKRGVTSHPSPLFPLILLTVLYLLCTLNCDAASGRAGRKWFIGGSFTTVRNPGQQDPITVNHITHWDEERWIQMDSGTNGTVHDIIVDLCRTVYIGGEFNMAGAVNTGPVAKWELGSTSWKPIFEGRNPFIGRGIVRSISVDCANFDINSFFGCVPCDVYIGGKFIIEVDGLRGYNVAKWTATSRRWDLLNPNSPNAPKESDEVHVIFKKAFGVTESSKFVWLGGVFDNGKTGFKKYRLNDQVWDPEIPVVKGVVYSLFYKPEYIHTDEMYIGGKFEMDIPDGKKCINVCKFDYARNEFEQCGIGNLPGPTGSVKSVKFADERLYIAGDFVSQNGNQHLMVLPRYEVFTSSWAPVTHFGDVNHLQDIDICSVSDPGCHGHSLTIVGNDRYLKFFNEQQQQVSTFGNGTNGDILSVFSVYTISSTASPLQGFVSYSLMSMSILLITSMLIVF